MKTFRDLTLVPTGNNEILVIACDSLGGIGPKPQDSMKTSGQIVGRYTARVPLMEIVAAGAQPIIVINTLSVEMNPSGKEILEGIKQEIFTAGLPDDLLVTGSTEENISTCQTALGVTVIGKAKQDALKLGSARAGNYIVCIGLPKVGMEILESPAVPDIPLVKQLYQLPWIQEILPVGSKGVLYEAEQLASGANCHFTLVSDLAVDMRKSAGPASCILVALPEDRIYELSNVTELPINLIGIIQ